MELDDLRLKVPLRQGVGGGEQLVGHHAVGHQGGVPPLPEDGRALPVPVRILPALGPPGIPDRHRPVHGQGRAQHLPQLPVAGRTQHGHARDLGQIAHVLTAVVGGAVGPHQSRPVHRQHHMEPLEGHVVEEHVKAPLQEGGIHREHRGHPLLGHAGGHGHRMALRDAHVKKTLGPRGGELLEARALPHGGGDGADAPVPPSQLHQLMAEDIGEVHLLGADEPLFRVKGPHAVAPLRLTLRRGVALALLGLHVEQHWASQLPGPGQCGA